MNNSFIVSNTTKLLITNLANLYQMLQTGIILFGTENELKVNQIVNSKKKFR